MDSSSFYKSIQELHDERFNDDFIHLKEKEESNIIKYMDNICKTLESIKHVKYVKSYIIPEKDVILEREFNYVNETRVNEIVSEFDIVEAWDDKNKVFVNKRIEVKLLFFKLINGIYFINNGIKYIPIYQIVENSYSLRNSINVKTLMMGINIIRNDDTMTTTTGEILLGHQYIIKMFNKQVDFMLYYIAKENDLYDALSYFNISKDEVIITDKKDNDDNNYDDYYNIITDTKFNLYIKKSLFMDEFKKNVIFSLFNILMKDKKVKANILLENTEFFKKLLSTFAGKKKIASVKQADNILLSFRRTLDLTTIEYSNVPKEYKQDIFTFIHYYIINYDIIYKQDNMDLSHKRLRFYEYMLMPLLVKYNKSVFRILNNKDDRITYKRIMTIFNSKAIPLNFLIKKLTVLDLIRYDNCSYNNIELFLRLKASQKGPQSLASRANTKEEIAVKYRGIHPSYLFKTSLVHSSASDPGMNFLLSPFLKLDDQMYFMQSEEENKIIQEISKDFTVSLAENTIDISDIINGDDSVDTE